MQQRQRRDAMQQQRRQQQMRVGLKQGGASRARVGSMSQAAWMYTPTGERLLQQRWSSGGSSRNVVLNGRGGRWRPAGRRVTGRQPSTPSSSCHPSLPTLSRARHSVHAAQPARSPAV
jgi:hypothetical protein